MSPTEHERYERDDPVTALLGNDRDPVRGSFGAVPGEPWGTDHDVHREIVGIADGYQPDQVGARVLGTGWRRHIPANLSSIPQVFDVAIGLGILAVGNDRNSHGVAHNESVW